MGAEIPLQPDVAAAASMSSDGLYRYTLRRTWDEDARWVTWIMLNPSVADYNVDDRTVALCQRFARRWGFGGIVVLNLFAYRATDPSVMKAQADPVGPSNDHYLMHYATLAKQDLGEDGDPLSFPVVAAWGNHGSLHNRAAKVTQMLTNAGVTLHCLRISKQGQPEHPLYKPEDLELSIYREAA